MTLEEEIDVIKKCEKAVYDYARYHYFPPGVGQAELVLQRKRKRLEKKLKLDNIKDCPDETF